MLGHARGVQHHAAVVDPLHPGTAPDTLRVGACCSIMLPSVLQSWHRHVPLTHLTRTLTLNLKWTVTLTPHPNPIAANPHDLFSHQRSGYKLTAFAHRIASSWPKGIGSVTQ